MENKNWTPVPGELIHVGIPSVSLGTYEFIGITSEGKFLYWSSDRTRAEVISPEFCYQIKNS